MKTNTKIIIIGAGPAGITAAIQLKRYGLELLLLEKDRAGGLLWNANRVENYPGFPNGVTGPKLVALMEKQMKRLGVEATREEAVNVELQDEVLIVETNKSKYKASVVVVAAGTKSNPIPDVIAENAKDRVFSEVWPLLEAREKRILIIGAGDAAFDYALNLSKKRNSVTILNRGEDVKCLGLLFERAVQEPRIEYRPRTAVRRVEADLAAGRLKVGCEAEGGVESLAADYVLFAIGREPNLDFLSEAVRQREQELAEAGRLYFVGDVRNGLFRQTAIAAGDGLRAAMQIWHNLEKR
jgi:thioredoxin reductase